MKGGYTGKILRVDLSNKEIKTIPTEKYVEFGGGHGIGSAIFFDLVGDQLPFEAFDPRNLIILMASPFSAVKPLVSKEVVLVVNTSEIPLTDKKFKDLPSATSLGYEGMSFPRWLGVHPDTPDEIVKAISDKTGKLLKDPAVSKLIKKIGEEIIYVPYPEVQKKYKNMVKGMQRAVKLLQ